MLSELVSLHAFFDDKFKNIATFIAYFNLVFMRSVRLGNRQWRIKKEQNIVDDDIMMMLVDGKQNY